MVEVKRGRGRPRKEPVGIFRFDAPKNKPVAKKAKKLGRPKGSKNKPKWPPTSGRTVEQRLNVLEMAMMVVVKALGILSDAHMKKKTR